MISNDGLGVARGTVFQDIFSGGKLVSKPAIPLWKTWGGAIVERLPSKNQRTSGGIAAVSAAPPPPPRGTRQAMQEYKINSKKHHRQAKGSQPRPQRQPQ